MATDFPPEEPVQGQNTEEGTVTEEEQLDELRRPSGEGDEGASDTESEDEGEASPDSDDGSFGPQSDVGDDEA